MLTTGRRTVANLIRTLGHLAPGYLTGYQRVFSRAPWSRVALARFLLRHFAPDGRGTLLGDDTVDGHKGKHVHGEARHRDPARSSRAYTAGRYGHRWVALAALVTLPLAARRRARPVPGDLDRAPDPDRAEGRPRKTPARPPGRVLRLPLTRPPGRAFVPAGDAGYGTRAVARFRHRHRARLAPVSKRCPGAHPFAPAPPDRGTGRPRVRGDRRPKPRAAAARRTRLTATRYGGGPRAEPGRGSPEAPRAHPRTAAHDARTGHPSRWNRHQSSSVLTANGTGSVWRANG